LRGAVAGQPPFLQGRCHARLFITVDVSCVIDAVALSRARLQRSGARVSVYCGVPDDNAGRSASVNVATRCLQRSTIRSS